MIKWFKKILGNYMFPYTRYLKEELQSKKDVIKLYEETIALHEERAYYSDKVIECNESLIRFHKTKNKS